MTFRSRRRIFIEQTMEAAELARAAGAPIVPAIAAAQAALESRFGESTLARLARNLFGIKAGRSWSGMTIDIPTTEYFARHPVPAMGHWKAYGSLEECFADYGAIIAGRPWFADAAAAGRAGDPMGFLEGLLVKDFDGDGAIDEPNEEPGWATDPHYREKVLSIARDWGLLA